MANVIQFKRGLQANLPATLASGEPAFTTDDQRLYIGTGTGRTWVGGEVKPTVGNGGSNSIWLVTSQAVYDFVTGYTFNTANYADGSITTAKIANNAITAALLNTIQISTGLESNGISQAFIFYDDISGQLAYRRLKFGTGMTYTETDGGDSWTLAVDNTVLRTGVDYDGSKNQAGFGHAVPADNYAIVAFGTYGSELIAGVSASVTANSNIVSTTGPLDSLTAGDWITINGETKRIDIVGTNSLTVNSNFTASASGQSIYRLPSKSTVWYGADGLLQGSVNAYSGLFDWAGSVNVGGNLTVVGDLSVQGAVTYVDSTNMAVEDNMVVFNRNETGAGVTAGTAGVEIERGTLTNVRMEWEETNDRWRVHDGTNLLPFEASTVYAAVLEGSTLSNTSIDGGTF